jgi:hypothetical protein
LVIKALNLFGSTLIVVPRAFLLLASRIWHLFTDRGHSMRPQSTGSKPTTKSVSDPVAERSRGLANAVLPNQLGDRPLLKVQGPHGIFDAFGSLYCAQLRIGFRGTGQASIPSKPLKTIIYLQCRYRVFVQAERIL